MLDALPAAIYITDVQGRITYFNEAAVLLWGHRPALGSSSWCGSWKLFWPDGRPLPHDECPMAIAVREQRVVRGMEAVAERPDGSRVTFIPYPTPLYDSSGTFIGAVNMLIDVTERSRANESAQHLAAIVESSDDAIISKDVDGIIRSWNRGAQRLFGYAGHEVIGKPVTVLMPPERVDEEPGILERIRRGERIDHYETVRRRKDGSLIDVSLCVSPIRDTQGRIVGASKIARDITERKRLQKQHELLLGEMKHRIKNSLANAQAIAMQTLGGISREELAVFSARLGALASAHDLLTLEKWNRSPLDGVVAAALGPFREHDSDRIVASGSDAVELDATQSLMLALALHELATNAVKYGALSRPEGRVHLGWTLAPHGERRRLQLVWRESGGPRVEKPTHKGFGSVLIRSMVGSRGLADFAFEPEGLVCTMEFDLAPVGVNRDETGT